MNEKRFVLIFILTIMFLINTGQSATLTLKECLHRAQQHSYRFKADEYLTKSAQQNYLVERSRTLPRFYGELSLEQRNLSSYNFRQQWALVHGDWALADFLLKTAHGAQQDALMVEAQKNQTELLVTRRAALLYMNILRNQTQANLLQKRFELLQAHYDIARALWQSGTRTQFDVLQTESELSQLQEQKAVLEIEHENLRVE